MHPKKNDIEKRQEEFDHLAKAIADRDQTDEDIRDIARRTTVYYKELVKLGISERERADLMQTWAYLEITRVSEERRKRAGEEEDNS